MVKPHPGHPSRCLKRLAAWGWLVVALAGGTDLSASPAIVINEVHYHPGDDSREGEFVELHNYGEDPVDVEGWSLTGGVLFFFEKGTVVPPGGFLLVAKDEQLLASRYDLDPSLIAGSYTGSLDNAGELIELFTDQGYLVSFVHYGDSDPWPETPDGLGPSLERLSPLLEDTDPRSWAASIAVGGTPADHNSVKIEIPETTLPGPTDGVELIPQGAVWRFFRGTAEPAGDWTDIGFDDSGWESGPAGFGYDDGDDATILDDMQGTYSTVYIRRSFEIADPRNVESLTLSVSFDDGFLAYLNGVEVARRNAAGPPGVRLPHDATATDSVGDAPTDVIDLDDRAQLLVAGDNVLAVHGLNGSIDSSDFSLHPSVTAEIAISGGDFVSFVPSRGTWRLFRGTEAPPGDWMELAFPDDGWETGQAGFGYGDGDDATLLDDMQDNYLTAFVRTKFQVEDRSRVVALDLILDYDDGFIAYLNGAEIARANVDSPGFDQPASRSHEAGTPESFTVPFPQDALRDGDNVLAIAGHNVRTTSSDFSLSPSLEGVIDTGDDDPPPDDPAPAAPPRDLVINELSAEGEGTGWVELYNPGDDPLDASERRILLFPPEEGDYSLPPGSIVAASGAFLVSESELGFELDAIGALILATEDGEFIDAINPRTTAPEHSTGRFPDGGNNRRVFADPTPGEPNRLEERSPVVINEIMYHPSDAAPGTEYIEFYNRSESAVNLGGWQITRGVNYSFPADEQIEPGGFVVVALDPANLEAHYGLTGALGPYAGRLDNDAETILVRDALGNPVERVRYADDGTWPQGTDGEGASAELVHPDLENRCGPAWAASEDDGTPGAPNSRFLGDPPPIVVDVNHSPVIPADGESVRVTATISDETGVTAATLFYELDGAGGPPSQIAMVDDGVGDDGVAQNGVYGARIPPQSLGAIIAFWIRAEAAGGQAVTAPEGAPTPAFLYQVDDPPAPLARPLNRVIMRAADLDELRNRDPLSNELLDLTFVADGRAWYNRGIRLRGRGARRTCVPPRSYRIQFDHDHDFQSIKRLNLNGCNVYRQFIGLDFLRRTGIPTPLAWFRRVAFNGEVRDGMRLRVEAIDEAFVERVFPGDDGGNLYRGERQADLQYRGEEFDPYRPHYEKHNNEDQDDFSDVIDLCFRLDPDTTPGEDFTASVDEVVDVYQWTLYFAAFAILGSTEGAIVRDTGDDYFMYRRPSDGLWVLLPWDLDSCFVEDDQRLFRPTLESVERFLEHPRYAPDYWCHVEHLLESAFDPDLVALRIDRLAPLFPAPVVEELRSFVPRRRQFIADRLSPELEITDVTGGALCNGFLEASGGSVTLEGRAPGCGTTEVLVNGATVDYDPVNTEWSGTVDLDGATELEIVSDYRGGIEVARLELGVLSTAAATPLPARISASLALGSGQSPYRAAADVTIASGATLQADPGVVLLFDADATLRVSGSLALEGSDSEPVILRSDSCGAPWEGIVFLEGSTSNRLTHCEIRHAAGSPAALVVDDTDLTLESVSLEIDSGTALLAQNGATVEIIGSALSGGDAGLVFTDSGGSLRSSVLRDFTGAAVLASGPGGERVHVEGSVIANCGAGLDSQSQDIELLDSRLHDISGTALRIADATATVQDSLLWRCGVGIELADGADGVLSHLTLYQAGAGLRLLENTPGAGSGAAIGESLIIWESSPAVLAEPSASLTISHSDTAGGEQSGTGNISADPLFVDAATDDFRLRAASPCRRTGESGTDMGALPYEPTGEVNRYTLCDSNGDGLNDLSDAVRALLVLFAGAAPAPCGAALDCNGDGGVDLSDPVFNLGHLFTGGPAPRLPYPDCEEAPAEECATTTCAN